MKKGTFQVSGLAVSFTLSFLGLLAFASALEAPPGLPVEYWGSTDAGDGLPVSVVENGKAYGNGSTKDGFFSVIITSDNPLTFLDDPNCENNNPCIPCSTDPSAGDYCLEGPQNGSTVDIQVGDKKTNASVSFVEDSGGEEIPVSLTFKAALSLLKGFNLISFPVNLSDYLVDDSTIATNPAGCLKQVYRYNASKGRYEVAIRDEIDGWITPPQDGFFRFESGGGYWFNANENCSLTLSGKEAAPFSLQMVGGFNLLGWLFHEEISLTPNPFLLDDPNCLTNLYFYDALAGRYRSAVFDEEFGWGSAEGLDSLEPGRGYWLRVLNNCRWDQKS